MYALIARREHEAGDPEDLQCYRKPSKRLNPNIHRIAISRCSMWRTQAIIGDRVGSDVSFNQAIEAAGIVKRKKGQGSHLDCKSASSWGGRKRTNLSPCLRVAKYAKDSTEKSFFQAVLDGPSRQAVRKIRLQTIFDTL